MISNLWRPTMLRYMAHATRNGGARFTPVEALESYGDGDILEVPGAPRVIHTPGHTGGHSSLLFEDAGVLFAGHALATMSLIGRPLGPQLMPFNEDRDRARESLTRLEELPAEVVVVGHDKAGLEEWFAKMEEVWEGGLRFAPEEVIAVDDEQVLAAVRTGGRGRGTGIELDQMIFHVYRIRGGKLVRLTTHSTWEEGLEAAQAAP